jgi:hypothetical protein
MGSEETMSKVKQRLLEKLKNIIRKKESDRKRRRVKRAPSKMFLFPKDKYEALEEIRKILGFTKEELGMLLALLEKSIEGHLDFNVGDITVEFHAVELDESSPSEISVIVELAEREITHRVEYRFNHGRGI